MFVANINSGEYGQTIYANLAQDVSSATSYKFILEPKVGTKIDRVDADGVALGASNIVVDDETYLANQYITYVTKSSDSIKAGLWRIRGEAILSSTNKVIGDFKRLRVLD